MRRLQTALLVLVAIFLCSCSGMQAPRETVESTITPAQSVKSALPIDPQVTKGKLANGLTYYIRKNVKPEKRMELRLVVRAGSVLEDDDQRGLAHFCEHMAFNGTEHFEKQELVDYLESIGMRFGPELNAYTSFDETVYMLQVPADSTEIVETAFRILEDWAGAISFEGEEIEKERGVVIEEWRLGRGADARIRDRQFPVLFKGSKYAERLPIGKKAVIESFGHDTLRRFYRDWYRPDLMAVVAVGDFDKAEIETRIRKHFSGLKNPKKTRERVVFPVPDHKEPLFAIATDPEATRTAVSIYHKRDVTPEVTETDYRMKLVESIYNAMLNQRLFELTKQAEPPFLYGYSGKGRFVLSKDVYILQTGVEDGGIGRGLEALLAEAARVERFGFTESELARQKVEFLSFIEQAYNERDKTESGRFADEYVRNFTVDEPIPGIEREFEMYGKHVPGITIEEVNRLAGEWISESNRVILVSAPEKPGLTMPDEQQLLAVISSVAEKEIEPYVDTVSDSPLVEQMPRPSKIVKETTIGEIGVTEWTLSNGIRVVLKPTDFKNDEILFDSYSPGGNSLVDDNRYIPASTATNLVREGGLGSFSLIDLNKLLAGKVVSVAPYIGGIQEGIRGGASPKDIETMFQLVYLYFTSPRKDAEAFQSFRTRMRAYVENRSARPETAFFDTLGVTLAQYHHRSRPLTVALLDELDLDASFDIYRDRFADAGDFTFFFVGAFKPEDLKPLVETYLGGLPTTPREETWRDVGIDYPKGVVKKKVRKGLEPKSRAGIVFSGPFSWSRENRYLLGSMTDVLDIKLREALREDLGGTYGVGVSQSVSHYPNEEYDIRISFGTSPDKVDELVREVFGRIDTLKTVGATEIYLNKVKETQRREREINLKNNQFWLGVLQTYYFHGEDPRDIMTYDELVESLTLEKIRAAAEEYFDTDNYVEIVLYPEE